MTLIDNFIHSLIRKRFNLPADTEIGIGLETFYETSWDERGRPSLDIWWNGGYKEYLDWDEFVADMERGGDA